MDRLGHPIDHHVRQKLVTRENALDVSAAIAPGPEFSR
jgi:hypothetical protein